MKFVGSDETNKIIARILCAEPRQVAGSGPLWPAEVVARFESYVDRSGGPDACHPWTGTVAWNGYGVFNANGTTIAAHRMALSLRLGRHLGRKKVTRHSAACVTRRCCNDRHLSEGTYADNYADTVKAGRANAGKAHVRLSEAQAVEVRSLYANGLRAIDVAASTGVSTAAVFAVISGRTWKRLGPPLQRRASRRAVSQ